MTEEPQPLTPPDCDLRHGFPYMPLHAARLRDSELASNETPEACWAAVLLWCASWHQVPAASVPDDETWLASQSKYVMRGKIDRAWKNVRTGALRGWIKCSDGRLYHPVVAEQALEAWLSKLVSSLSGATGNAKRWGIEIDTDAVRMQIVDAAQRLRAIAPRSEWLKKKQVRDILKASPPDEAGSPPDDKSGPSRSQDGSPPDQDPSRPPIAIENIANEMKLNEVNTIGSSGGIGNLTSGEPVDNAVSPPAAVLAEELRKNGIAVGDDDARIESWLAVGATPADIATAVGKAHARRTKAGSSQPVNVGFIDTLLGDVLAARRAASGNPAASKGPWHRSWSGIVAYGRELDVEQADGEPDVDFKLRVFHAAGDGPWWAEHFPDARRNGPVPVSAVLRGGHAA
jgi:hypothetical protein